MLALCRGTDASMMKVASGFLDLPSLYNAASMQLATTAMEHPRHASLGAALSLARRYVKVSFHVSFS